LPSTTTIDGQLVSRISPNLPTGSIATTARHQVDVIVTEYATAELRGLTVRERAKAVAAIGHPAFREELDAMAAMWP
jgi:acyl-CoA hydrolase